MQDFTRAAQALSDETRIRILHLLMIRECCVCEVMQALDISQTRASRNLKILYDARFLEVRNDGLFTLYSLKAVDREFFHNDLLKAVKKRLSESAVARKDVKRLKTAKRVGTGCLRQMKGKTKDHPTPCA
jgi:ArsR family transcriptional regulator